MLERHRKDKTGVATEAPTPAATNTTKNQRIELVLNLTIQELDSCEMLTLNS